MAQAMLMRRGGSSLNSPLLSVTRYDSALLLPATANPYDIAVITMTAFGTIYERSTAPLSPVEGDLWILLGSKSPQPILIGLDQIAIYPRAVYQYLSGVWTNVPGYVFSSGSPGSWIVLSTYIYDSGLEILVGVEAGNQGYSYSQVSIIEEAARITFDHNAQSGRWLWTDTAVDVTEMATLKARISNSYTSGYAGYFGIISNKASVGTGTPTASAMSAYATLNVSRNNAVVSVDISNFDGDYFVGIYFYNPIDYVERVYAIWMEP